MLGCLSQMSRLWLRGRASSGWWRYADRFPSIVRRQGTNQAMRRTTTRWQRLLCGTLLALVGATLAHAQTAQEIARKAFGSTVLLVMEDANRQPLSLGSGFFVRDG